ncbi:MAG: hypothetical protein IIA44_12555, partial [Acidobacteria bacterium]|nr:hypothetical protein [Acidobacteriota bacterium]
MLLAAWMIGAVVPPATAYAAPEVQYDRTRIVVKLAPVGTTSSASGGFGAAPAPQKITAGQSGRAVFDRIITDYSVTSVVRVFAPRQAGHRLEDLAMRLRLADYVLVQVPANVDAGDLLAKLKSADEVETAEFDVVVRIAGSITPDDPYFATHQ